MKMPKQRRRHRGHPGCLKKSRTSRSAGHPKFPFIQPELTENVLSFLSPAEQQLSRGTCRAIRDIVDTRLPLVSLVNLKWKRFYDYEILGGTFSEERVRRTDNLLGLLDILPTDYPTGFFLENDVIPYYVEETEQIAFDEAFDPDRRITRAQLIDFYRSRHESYCYYLEDEMQQWSFFAFQFFLELINERADEVPIQYKIQVMDLYHWLESKRLIDYADKIYLSQNIEVWKQEYLHYYAGSLFDSLFLSL